MNKLFYKKILYLIIILIVIFQFSSRYNRNFLRDIYQSIYTSLFPYKEKKVICGSLQSELEKITSMNRDNWSITVLDDNGNIVSDINGDVFRTPASNIKLITTAYSLDRLGPMFTLKTSLYSIGKGKYFFVGQGDPDLNRNDIDEFSSILLDHFNKSNIKNLSITLFEEPRSLWWPSSWSYSDRYEAYGAPISRLAITGNADNYSFQYPLDRFKLYLQSSLNLTVPNFLINIKAYSKYEPNKSNQLIHVIPSAPVYALINLANSHSHNFTSEVLLRLSSNEWDSNLASLKMNRWVSRFSIPKKSIQVEDGSGLSRLNKTTTKGLSNFLYTMTKHRFNDYYLSSLSILGVRGTLKDFPYSSQVNGKFFGKTGTLTGVRSLSGYLITTSGVRVISIIANTLSDVDYILLDLLESINSKDECFSN